MGVYTQDEFTQDHLLEIAKACGIAAAKAPTITNQLDLKMEILTDTDNDLDDIHEVLATLGKTSAFQLHDAVVFKKLKELGKHPPLLLLGADLTKPPLWDCGACGFKSCGDYIKYVSTNKGTGIGAYGPSCLWKVVDFGIACDYAAAAAAMHRVETRLLFSLGATALFLNRLEGSSFIIGMPVGPVGMNNWFDRDIWQEYFTYENRLQAQLLGGPSLYMAFSGTGNPVIKSKSKWWEDPTFLKIEQDEDFVKKDQEGKEMIFNKIMELSGVLDEE